jgi:hypothetical protein
MRNSKNQRIVATINKQSQTRPTKSQINSTDMASRGSNHCGVLGQDVCIHYGVPTRNSGGI